MSNNRIDPVKLGVEGLVIVASILLAFALQAWWDERQEDVIELDMLVALQSELSVALTLLDVQIDAHVIHGEVAIALADRLAAAGEGAIVTVDDQYVALLLNNPTYDSPVGITNALLASGQTSVLTNADLRAAIGRWPAAIADGYEDQIMLLESASRHLAPLLHRSIASMRNAYTINAEQESNRKFSEEELGTVAEITASAELWNALYERHSRTAIAMADLRRTREQLIELITLVEGELN